MRPIVPLFVSVLLVCTSCSDETIQDISAEESKLQEGETNSTDFLKTNENLTSNFLPAFMSHYGRDRGTSTNRSSSLASEWKHEYDDNQKLIRSSFFELFPYRILREVEYQNEVTDHKLRYEIKEYSYYGLPYSYTDTYELTFDENLNIRSIGDAGKVVTALNREGRITGINSVAPNGVVMYQIGYEYDEYGNTLKYISYDAAGNITSTVDYSYNENGDPLTYHFQNTRRAETKATYYYREDHTLERLEEEYDNGDNDFGMQVFTYGPEERLSKRITAKGDGSKEITTYAENELIAEYFEDDVLQAEYFYHIQKERYLLKAHKEYLDGVIHKVAYYNADEELDYTEYYDENGNLTETVQE